MATTLSSIAKRVGVDISLVSRVIRGDELARISDEKRRRILEIAEAEGYRPNRVGRSLKTGRTNVLGVLTPDITNPFYSLLFRGIEAVAMERGYNTILCNTDDNPDRSREIMKALSEGHVDALFVCSARSGDTSIEWLRRSGLRYVLVNRWAGRDDDPWVGPDDFEIGRIGAEHLIALGHRRIAFVLGDMEVWNHQRRLAGFLKALDDHAMAPDQSLLGIGLEAPRAFLRNVLARPGKTRPTAIFAPQTYPSNQAISALFEAQLLVPDQISFVGFNSGPGGEVTSVWPPMIEIGRHAADYLIDLLEAPAGHPPHDPVHLAFPPVLIDHGTTAPPPKPK